MQAEEAEVGVASEPRAGDVGPTAPRRGPGAPEGKGIAGRGGGERSGSGRSGPAAGEGRHPRSRVGPAGLGAGPRGGGEGRVEGAAPRPLAGVLSVGPGTSPAAAAVDPAPPGGPVGRPPGMTVRSLDRSAGSLLLPEGPPSLGTPIRVPHASSIHEWRPTQTERTTPSTTTITRRPLESTEQPFYPRHRRQSPHRHS